MHMRGHPPLPKTGAVAPFAPVCARASASCAHARVPARAHATHRSPAPFSELRHAAVRREDVAVVVEPAVEERQPEDREHPHGEEEEEHDGAHLGQRTFGAALQVRACACACVCVLVRV